MKFVYTTTILISHSPNDSGYNTTCLDDCNRAFCMATYYSTEVRTPSESCKTCDDPTDLSCLSNWSKCVRRQDRATYGPVSLCAHTHTQ